MVRWQGGRWVGEGKRVRRGLIAISMAWEELLVSHIRHRCLSSGYTKRQYKEMGCKERQSKGTRVGLHNMGDIMGQALHDLHDITMIFTILFGSAFEKCCVLATILE